MLTGHVCGGGQRAVAAEAALAPRALASLRQFAFVGVTDEWNRTLRAFSHAFDVRMHASDAAVRRRGARPADTSAYDRAAAILRAMRFADEPLYAEALRILSALERDAWKPAELRAGD